jgi:hypothetical protein
MPPKKQRIKRDPYRSKFVKADDPFEAARQEAVLAKRKAFKQGVPRTREAQGVLGLRLYAESFFQRMKQEGLLGPMFHTKKLFLEWYEDHPRPGNAVLTRIDPKEKYTPHNSKYTTNEAFKTVAMLQRRQKGKYFGVSWDPGFGVHIPGVWRGEIRVGDTTKAKRATVFREFPNEKQAARYVDWVLEQKYGTFCVFNRDIDKTLGHEDFDDVPLELYGR